MSTLVLPNSFTEQDLDSLTIEEKLELLELLQLREHLEGRNKMLKYYPDTGPLRRELYQKHLEFFRAGRQHRERCFLAANRVGKTEGVGAYESTLHLTGRYPDWWEGRRFDHPISAWAAGDSSKTTRDIIQQRLLGPSGSFGTGMIPGDCLIGTTAKPGVPDAVETVYVRHVSGGRSDLTLKSYDQGRASFQGTNKDLVWLDEECERDIYVECLMRTMTTNGIMMITFTPLLGMTDIIRDFLNVAVQKAMSKYVVTATWDDVPHLTPEAKAELLAGIPPYQREARTKGVPQLGSGAIYPVPESDVVVSDFEIPAHYPRAYGLDVGWNRTAAIWGARDNQTGVVYLYSEHYRGQAEPIVHVQAIKSRGEWIPGVIDPAARGRSQKDGSKLLEDYQQLGLDIEPAVNAVEAGIYEVWQLLSVGKLKVFKSLPNWLAEFRIYQRDQDGRILKENDHLMDATRYLIISGRDRMKSKLAKKEPTTRYVYPGQQNSWMA